MMWNPIRKTDTSWYHILKPKEDPHEATARPASQESVRSFFGNPRRGQAQTRSTPALPQLPSLAAAAPSINFPPPSGTPETASPTSPQPHDRQHSKASDRQVSKK